MTLSVITANMFRGNPDPRALAVDLTGRADVFGHQEATRLPEMKGYQRHQLERRWGKEATEVAIDWDAKKFECHGVAGYQETRDLGTKFSPDRWTVWARLARPGRRLERYAVMVTHMNAPGAEDREHREESDQEWARHLRSVLAVAAQHQRQGWAPVILADWNKPNMGSRLPAPWRWVGQHVDGAAFLPSLEQSGDHRSILLPGSDHRGHRVNLRPTPRAFPAS